MTDESKVPERSDLRIANALRDVVNEALARYDVPSEVYEQDVLIDAECVCTADKILREHEQVQAMVDEARREEREAIANGIYAKIGPRCHPDSIKASVLRDVVNAIRARGLKS